MAHIEITWVGIMGYIPEGKALTTAAFEFDTGEWDDLSICERIFKETNLYQGDLWNVLEPLLPSKRTHTALSVDDLVSIDGRLYRCSDFGFKPIVKCPECFEYGIHVCPAHD